eukprot:GHVR01109003.1.p1 GENE.GHVR01109003.1~~GHVR01109003.1.p1  ORF type:complete len:185 (-),score=53.95 GHVR01109003.1:158-712(-)
MLRQDKEILMNETYNNTVTDHVIQGVKMWSCNTNKIPTVYSDVSEFVDSLSLDIEIYHGDIHLFTDTSRQLVVYGNKKLEVGKYKCYPLVVPCYIVHVVDFYGNIIIRDQSIVISLSATAYPEDLDTFERFWALNGFFSYDRPLATHTHTQTHTHTHTNTHTYLHTRISDWKLRENKIITQKKS